MTDALLVNPYNPDAIADRLRAKHLKCGRNRAPRECVRCAKKIRHNNLERWSANFLGALTMESGLEPRNIAQA